jgi:hypothetical protein
MPMQHGRTEGGSDDYGYGLAITLTDPDGIALECGSSPVAPMVLGPRASRPARPAGILRRALLYPADSWDVATPHSVE